MNDQKNIPVYGDAVLSKEYESCIKRRSWIKHNRNRLIIGACVLLLAVATALTIMTIL